MYKEGCKTTLIIPDVHHQTDWADQIIKNVEHDKVIFLGDYFDGFNDNEIMAAKTAWWLKGIIHNPNYRFIMGNHDCPYRWPNNPFVFCPGFTQAKSRAINQILKKYDWDVMRFLIIEQGFWLSHAGVNFNVFNDRGVITKEFCKKILDLATQKLEHNQFAFEICEQSSSITWLRFPFCFPLQGISQIVGHTSSSPLGFHKRKDDGHFSLCLDSPNGNYFGVIKDAKFYYGSVEDYKLKDI